MPRLEDVANIVLRVPSILVLDLLYKCDIDSFTEHLRAKNEDMLFKYKYVIWNLYYLGHVINVVMLLLPLRHIIKVYLYILTTLLFYVGHQISKDYVHGEVQYGYDGALYLDSQAFNRFVSSLTSQVILSTLCAFLMKTRKVWLFSAHLLPLLARLCAMPHNTLLLVNSFSTALTGIGVAMFLLSNLFVPYRLARAACSELLQLEVIELYRLLAVTISLWNQFAVPVLFSVFWSVLFVVQLCSYSMTNNTTGNHEGVLFFLLTSVSECCVTPYSLLGLTSVVSYLGLGLLNLTKFYLGGYTAVQNDNVMHRGVTEGVTLLLLALQTGLLDMQALQRTFLLSIILFIVVTSTLQSMIEITDPIILALGASRNRSLWKHFRGLSMCLVLLVFPGYMAYKISQFFHMDFWLLILVSSCMLTSLQVTGTLLIYSLFMVELSCSDPIDSLDEIIYWVNAVSRVLEFVVALCVVAYGTWESLFGEWSWMGASVIIIHCYFNVWLRAQTGWRSFLLRQEAAKKINSLPRATANQLQQHNDVCAICFQCPSVGQILSHYGLTNASQLTVEHLERICPAVLTQVLLPSCPYKNPTALHPVTYHVWGYGFLSVTIINLASLLGLALIPFTKKTYFPKVLTYFIGLAIGTLFSNAVLQLIPEALGFDPRADDYILKAVGIFGGFYLLFFTEKVLKMALRTEHEHGHSHFSPPGQLRQNSLQNGDVSEKKESITMTTCTISSIGTDNTSPDAPVSSTEPPPQEVHVNNVMCHWLRGQRVANIKTVAWMVTLSDALHNFIDGLAIGASFTVSVVAGFSTSIAIVCEEFPHELGDFVILLNAGMSIPQAVFFNLLSAMSCYIGLAFGILLGSNFAPNAIFAIAGGMFLYIALADMFPEMNAIMNEQDGSTVTNVIFFLIQNAGLLTGFAIILLITMFVGEINLG